MDKRKQSILKPDGRIPLQETLIPDFPDEDTATVTVTKSRRVSFGANFVKEFVVGSAVSTQYVSEYEQAVSSSDSSNPNSSRSGILDQSTFQCDDDVLNLCVKRANHDQFGPMKKKFCFDKQNIYSDINEKNNENIWDFNVANGSNIFVEKNMSYTIKPDPSRNNVRCNKNVNPLNDSPLTDKQFQNKRNESELNSSKLNETLDKKSKVGKFSSTIFFSADSPTADVEFTEGCISLAKSIFDKKKKDMTVYIKGTPKESNKEDERDGSNTVVFESDDSDVGMKLTKCMDESESESDLSTGNFSNYCPIPKGSDPIEEFDESHENIENVPFHTYSLNVMLGRRDNSQGDSELEKSIFHPDRSLTEMLRSDPLKTTMTDFSSSEKDNTEECDMEISASDMLKTSIIDEDFEKMKEESIVDPVVTSSPLRPPAVEDDDCTSPVFSKITVEGDFSLTSEDTMQAELSAPDPLRMSICDDLSFNGNEGPNLELSNCSHSKNTESETVSATEERVNPPSMSVEDLEDSDKNCPVPEDNQKRANLTEVASCPSVEENKEVVTSLTMTETLCGSQLKEGAEETSASSAVKAITGVESPAEELPDAGEDTPPEMPQESREEETRESEVSLPVPDEVNQEMDAPVSQERESVDCLALGETSAMERQLAERAESSVSSQLSKSELNFSDFVNPIAVPESGGDAEEPSFLEDGEESAAFDTSKMSTLDLPFLDEDKIEVPSEDSAKLSERKSLEMEMSGIDELMSMGELKSPTKVECEGELSQVTYLVGRKEESLLQETRFAESSFAGESTCESSDRTSLGDRKILDLLKEQSEESNCCWTIDSINREEEFWSFSFPIRMSSAVMKFKLMPPKDKSLVSFSVVLDGSLELRESDRYQLEKDRIGIDFAFGKLKSNFQMESRGLENVRKMPLFLDKMNLITKKMNGIMNQIIQILKDYPGSKLRESVLSFRVYSFPLLFSYLVSIDLTDPFQLSENSVTAKKHFGNFNAGLVKSVFVDCLGREDFLVRFVRILTESVVGMERKAGSVTKRSHIRLVR